MMKLIKIYNELMQQFEDWTFKYVVPPVLKIIEIGLKVTMFFAFYHMFKNIINESF